MPTKPATNGAGRALVDLGRAADLLEAAVVEDGDPVAHGQRLLLVMGDEDEGDADVALELLELDLHLLGAASGRGRRAARRAAAPWARLTSARASATRCRWPPESWAGLRSPRSPSCTGVQRLGARSRRSALGTLRDPQPVRDVVHHGHVREQRVVLEHGVDVAVERRPAGDVAAAELDRAGGRQLEAGDHPQHRGLAGARRARAWRRTRRRGSSRSTSSTATTSPKRLLIPTSSTAGVLMQSPSMQVDHNDGIRRSAHSRGSIHA